MGAADSNLKDSNMDNLTINMDQDQIATSPIAKELATQLGIMTLKNIVRQSPEKTISLQDLCNQFITQAEETEKEALGQETSDVVGALKQYPGMFTIPEDREGAISVQLVNDTCIPPLLSAVVKVKGKLKAAGTLSVEDLSRWFQENCSSEEIEAVEKGDSELLKKTLLSLPSIFCLSGDQISLVLSKEEDKVNGLKDDETHDDDDDEEEEEEEEEEDKNGIGEEEEEGHQLSNDEQNNDQNSASVNKTEIELSREADSEVAVGDRDRNGKDDENIQEYSDKGIPLSDDKAIGVEVFDNHDGVDDKDIGVEVLDNHDGGTHSDIQADELEGKYDVSEEEESKSEEDDVDVVGDESQQSTASVNLSLSSGDSSSSPISADAVNVSAVEEEEEEEDIFTKFTKQLGIMKIKNILKERGPVSLQVLNAMFGNKGTKEERDVVGRKGDQVLETLTQFKDICVFESHPEKGGTLLEQQFVRLKESSEEVSLALARAVLKIPVIIEERGNLNANQLSTVLNQRSSVAERAAVGKNHLLLKETLLALPTVFTFSGEKVCVISNNLPNEQLGVNFSTVEEEEDGISTKFTKQLGILRIKTILKERGSVSLQVLNGIFGSKGTKEERDVVGRKGDQVLETMTQFKDIFVFESHPEKGGTLLEQQFVRLKESSEEVSLALARAVLKIPGIIEEKGNVNANQLSTALNQRSSVVERAAVGKSPLLLKETLLALPTVFTFSGEKVCVISNNLPNEQLLPSEQKPQAASAEPSVPAVNTAAVFDDAFVYKHLGMLKLKDILQRKGSLTLQKLCSEFGGLADDDEREAVGWRAMVVLQTVKEFPSVFAINLPRKVDVQTLVDRTKVYIKPSATNQTPVPYARAMLKLIWYLKQKGTMLVTQLSSLLGQNSTVEEREAVGKSPGSLKATLKTLPQMFSVSSDKISVVNKAHIYALKQFVLCTKTQPGTKAGQKPAVQPAQGTGLMIPNDLERTVVATVTECLYSRGGSCDVTILTAWIKRCGSAKEINNFADNGGYLLKVLRTMPHRFIVQGSKVGFASSGDVRENASDGAASGLHPHNVSVPHLVNPVPKHGVLPISQAKVIPSIEIVFDTKNTGANGWGDISVSQALTTGVPSLSYAKVASGIPPLMLISSPSKQSALQKVIGYLEQAKIATFLQLGGRLNQLSAAERNAVGKNSGLLYDTLVTMPDKFVIVGPFVGVKSHAALVTGIAKLVNFVESKGQCEISSLTGRLSHIGTSDERQAISRDLETCTKTITDLPGIFIVEESSVYLNNGMGGQPCAPTPMNKVTATNTGIGWVKSAGTSFTNVTPVLNQTEALMPVHAPVKPIPQTMPATQDFQASTTGVQDLPYAKLASGISPLMLSSSPAGAMANINKTLQSPSTSNSKATSKPTKDTCKQSALQNIIAYLEQIKIATILQLGGGLGKLTAEERNAIGKSPDLFYDTFVSMPEKFIIVGPFVGVKSQAALVTGIARLVNFVESKGKCKITSLPGVLGQSGTKEERAAIGKDMDIFTKTISTLTGIFIVEESSVYLNNGMGGQACAPTPMNKATATNQNIGWVKSVGTVFINATQVLNQTEASVPAQALAKPNPQTVPATQDSHAPIGASYTLHVVAITDAAMCQEFVDECLSKYEYPIISVSVRKKKWIAIAGWEGQVYMFDMEGSNAATASPGGFRILADIISSDKILKVVQDCRYVSSILYECFGMKLANVFDTKVAYQLLTGESNVTLDTLCNKFGVAVPCEWNAILSNKASAAAETVSRPPDVALGAWVRVLIPQIYQHMVMKFSSDSLQEVGKLCEAFLHQEGTKAASSALPVSSESALPVSSESALPVSSESVLPVSSESVLPVSSDTQPSATSHGYATTASPPDTSTVTTQVNQSLLHSDSTPLTTQVNQSLLQVKCTSFEATHSKICSYLEQNGPSSVMKLYEVVHGTANVSDDLESFQKTLLKTSSRYILLESGLFKLVEHVQSSAAIKILGILEGKGVLKSAQLLRYFKEVATVDEVLVVATTKSAFLKTLALMDAVCVLKDRKICLWSDVREHVVNKVAEHVKQRGSIDVEELTRWFQKRATPEELQVCQEGLLDVLNAEKDVFYVHNSLVEVIADGRKGSNELVSDYLPLVVLSPRRSGLAEHPENLEDSDPIGISKVSRVIQDGYITWKAEGSTSVIEMVTEVPLENCQKHGSNMDQRRCTDVRNPDEATVKTDVSVSFSQKDDNISETATADAGLLNEDDLLTLRHYTDENGPTTISQLQSLLHKTTTVSSKKLKTALQNHKDLFRFTKGGLVYSDEVKLRAVYKLANYLEDRGISTIEDVRDWFCLYVPRQEKSAFPVFYDICEFRKQLECFPHIFVLGEYGENSVSVSHNFSSETILPQDTEVTPTRSDLDKAQVDSDCIDESSNASKFENEPVTSRRKRKRARQGTCSIGTSKQINLLQFYVDTNGPKSMEELHKRLQTIVGSDVSFEKFQEVLTFDASISSFIKMPSGLVSSPIQLIASFLERKGSSDISSIYGWVVDSYGESDFGSSEKAVLERLNVLSHIFDVGRKGKRISLQPNYVSSRMKINADGSGDDISISKPIYNKLGFLKGSYMKLLWIYLEQNGPTDLVELLGLVHQKLGSEDIITKEELRRNIKAFIYNMNFTISRNSDVVEPNRAKQQGANKVAQFIETSNPKSIAEVWEWFDLHGSLSEKRSLGETQKAFTTKLKAMPSVFNISRKCVSLNSKYQCNDTYQPEDVSAKSADELCACETMGATLSQAVLSTYDDRVTRFRAEEVRITRISEGFASAHSTVTESSQKDNILVLMKKGSLRKTFKELLHNFVELNGPTTLLQLHSELHKKIGEENVMSLEELKKALQNSGNFKFQSSDLIEVAPKEVWLAAVNKVVQFLEMNGPCSISDVHSWFCQHANQSEMGALRATRTAARFKNGLKSFPFMLLVENGSVALHPDFCQVSNPGTSVTMTTISSQLPAISNRHDNISSSATSCSQVNQSLVNEEMTSFEATQSKICAYLKQNGPSSVLRLHNMLHGSCDVEDGVGNLDSFQKTLLKTSSRYILLESGLVDLVEHVQSSAAAKICNILEGKGVLESAQLLRHFKEVATVDEVKVVALTKSAFLKTLALMDTVCVLKDRKVCLWSDVRKQVVNKVAEHVKQRGRIDVKELIRWFQKKATTEELQVCGRGQEGLIDVLIDAKDVFSVQNAWVTLIAEERESNTSSDALSDIRTCQRGYGLVEVPSYSEATDISQHFRKAQMFSTSSDDIRQTGRNVFQGKYQQKDVINKQIIDDKCAVGSDLAPGSLQKGGVKTMKTSIVSATKDYLADVDLATLQHYTDNNGPTTVSQLQSLLQSRDNLSTEELQTVLQSHGDPFRFTEGGLVYTDEVKLRAVYKIAKYLEDRVRRSIQDVRDWFYLHVPKQNNSSFPASYNICEFRKQLERFPHIFVLGEHREDWVSIPQNFSPDTILPRDANMSSKDTVSDRIQMEADEIKSRKENVVVSASRKGRTQHTKNRRQMLNELKQQLLFYVDTSGPKSMEELFRQSQTIMGGDCEVSVEEIHELVKFGTRINSFTLTPSGLVSSPVQQIVSFLEREATSDIAKIYAWLCQQIGSDEENVFGSTEKAVLRKLQTMSHIFHVKQCGKHISLQPTYVSNRGKVSGEPSNLKSLSLPIYNNLGYLKAILLKPLWIYVEVNGLTNLTELLSLLHQELGSEDIISKNELKRNMKSILYQKHFKIHRSDMVGLNEEKQQAAQEVAQFVGSSGETTMGKIWKWFDQHGSKKGKEHLGESERVLRTTLMAMSHIFHVLGTNHVCLNKCDSCVTPLGDDNYLGDDRETIREDSDHKLSRMQHQIQEFELDYPHLCIEDQEKEITRSDQRYQSEGICEATQHTKCSTRTVVTKQHKENMTSSENPLQLTNISTSEEQVNESIFIGFTGFLKHKYILLLQTHVIQNGPTSVTEFQNLLMKQTGNENVPSLEKLEESLHHHHTKFTFLSSGLIGPNETMMRAADKIANILKLKGTSTAADLKYWYWQYGSEEEQAALCLSSTRAVKRTLKLFPHMFVIGNGSVGLHPDYTLRETSSLSTETCNQGAHVLLCQTSQESQQDHDKDQSEQAVLCKQSPDVSLPCTTSQENHQSHGNSESEQAMLCNQNFDVLLPCKSSQRSQPSHAKNKREQAMLCYQNPDVSLPCKSSQESQQSHGIDQSKQATLSKQKPDVSEISNKRSIGEAAIPSSFAEDKLRISLPQQDNPLFGRSGFLKNKYVEPLQIHINQNGPTSLAELQKVLYHIFGSRIALSTEELRQNLLHHGTKFVFLPDGRIGPNDTQLQALNKIVEFLEKEGPSSIIYVRNWYRQHGSEEEQSTSGLLERKSLKKYLKKYPHIFVVGENEVALQPAFKDAIPSTMADKTSTTTENHYVQEKCHEGTLETSQFGWSAFKTEVSLSSERTMRCSEKDRSMKEKCPEVPAISETANKTSTSTEDYSVQENRHEGTLETTQFGWSAFKTEVSLSSERTMRCSEKDRSMKAKCLEVPAISETAKYGLSAYETEASLSSGSTEENFQITNRSYQNEEAVMQQKTNLIIPSTSNPSSTPDPKTSSSLLINPSHTILSTSPDHLITNHVSHDDSGFEATSFVSEYALNAAREGVFDCNSDKEVLNPWDITQQLRDEFASKNKQDMDNLMAVFGEDISHHLTQLSQSNSQDHGLTMLTEVVLDYGRFAQARFYQKSSPSGCLDVIVSSDVVTKENIESILDSDCVTSPTADNRAGIEGTLHRLGIISNRSGHAIGLTACIGRPVLGCVDHIYDLLQDDQSVVLLGSPGVGMTTVLREISRVLSDVKKRRVVVIDTYNQIGGDSDVPHPAIGSARRLQVASGADQCKVMIEALKNHNPQTVIIDEIATASDAQGVRNLVQRGVQVIATAHSCNFVDFFQNHEFKHVSGMVQGADGGGKALPERVQDPAFQVLIELNDRDTWIIHKDLASSIDLYLQGMRPIVQERQQTPQYDNKGALIGQQCTVKLIEATVPSLLGM